MTTMNLTTDPWIPALHADGRRELFSLQGLFAQGHELRDLAVKPHERIALMRLLLCITQAALNGPEDEDDWADCQSHVQQDVRAYLDKWMTGFELFGPGPRFLQVEPGVIAEAKPAMEDEPISRLNLSMPLGAILFDNAASDVREFSNAATALSLLTYQCYSPLLGRGYTGRSPCADESMLHTFILGPNLLTTVRLNLLTKADCNRSYSYGIGKPIWEIWTSRGISEQEVILLTKSYLGRLLPVTRSIWLNNLNTMSLGNGLSYESFADTGYREASATVVASKTEVVLLSARTSRALWRELPAVCVKRQQADGVSGPYAFRNAIPGSEIHIWTGALIFPDKNAKIEDAIESVYSLPAGMLSEFGREAYERGVIYAEEKERVLMQAVKAYAASLKVVAPAYDQARRHFWTRVEQHLPDLLELPRNTNLVLDLPACAWGRAVQAAAFDAYEQTCPRQTPRQIQAHALGLRKLTYRPKPDLIAAAANPL